MYLKFFLLAALDIAYEGFRGAANPSPERKHQRKNKRTRMLFAVAGLVFTLLLASAMLGSFVSQESFAGLPSINLAPILAAATFAFLGAIVWALAKVVVATVYKIHIRAGELQRGERVLSWRASANS